MLIAAGWIIVLLSVGGFALDRTLNGLITRNFDEQLDNMLTGMVGSTEIGPMARCSSTGRWGISAFWSRTADFTGKFAARGMRIFTRDRCGTAVWRQARITLIAMPDVFNSSQFAGEPLRIIERTIILPSSETQWQFTVAASRKELETQIRRTRSILAYSFIVLGLGLFIMAGLQTWYGLSPLRRIRQAIKLMRATGTNRVTEPLPLEVQPLVIELNALLAHTEQQAEEARTHAGNLAHALKTPLTVVMNAATARAPDLSRHSDSRGGGDAAPSRSPSCPGASCRAARGWNVARQCVGERRGSSARGNAALSHSAV